MKQQRSIMGMPITVEIADARADAGAFQAVFGYFEYVDGIFSTYKSGSEISRLNRGEIKPAACSPDLQHVLTLCEQTKKETNGYFDIRTPSGGLDPSGLVKGWAIFQAAKILERAGWRNFFIEAGGDIQVRGSNGRGEPWRVGIRNPFQKNEIVKVVYLQTEGIATSGAYERGAHIYNPHDPADELAGLASVTVIGENIYEADRFATAAYAMGRQGIVFLEKLPGLEAYVIDSHGVASMTSGFERYTKAS